MMPRKVHKELVHTCWHEAGHAVAALFLGRKFKLATVVPGKETLGHVLFCNFQKRFRPDVELTPARRDLLERCAIVSYAGSAAAGLLKGKDFDWSGAERDRKHALDFLSYIASEPDALGALSSFCQLSARNLIRSRKNEVSLIAQKLNDQKTLSFSQILQLVNSLYPPLPSVFRGKTVPSAA